MLAGSMLLRRLFRSPTVGSIADWTAIIQLVWPFLAGSALLGWIASAIEPVMRYGWGAAFFLGLISTCVIVVIASIDLIAWRYYKPLKPDQHVVPDQRTVEENASRAAAAADIQERLHSVEGQARITFDIVDNLQKRVASEFSRVDNSALRHSEKFKQIDELLKPDPGHLTLLGRLGDTSPPPKNKFESLEREIKRIGDQLSGSRDAIVHLIDQLKGQIKSTDQQVSTTYRILSTSLRARDAREIIVGADKIVTTVGDNLLKSDFYKNDDDWRIAYSDWYKALDTIDRLSGQWTEHHKPFLGITHRDYERTKFAAPANIVSKNDENSIRYKNVWIAQQDYANRRDNILSYFEHKTSELPG